MNCEYTWKEILKSEGVYQPLSNKDLRLIVQTILLDSGEEETQDVLVMRTIGFRKNHVFPLGVCHLWYDHKFIKTGEQLRLVKLAEQEC